MNTFDMNNAVENALKPTLDRYAIYLRKSREDEKAEARGEGETLARHKKILTDYAARRGLFIEKIYEEVVSGETIKDRPLIQQLISECYAGKYKGIIVVEVSRLSRGNQGDAQTILDCLKYGNNNSGVLILTPTKTYDVAHNPDDEEYMEFELFMSRREYKMITKRMQRGREQAIIEGNYLSQRPYGYNIVETPYARTLAAHPVEAPIVQKMFEWRVNKGMTPGEIAKKLNNQGVPTFHTALEWNRGVVRQILDNPVYCGKVKWKKTMQVKAMEEGKLVSRTKKMVGTEHYMEYEGKHDGIISEEMFRSAQKMLRKDNTKQNFALRNPLAGLLVCAKCKRSLVYYNYGNGTRSRPRLSHPTSQKCKVKSAVCTEVVDAVIFGLKQYLENFKVEYDNKPDADADEIKDQIAALEAEKKKVKKKLDKAFDDYEDGVYSANEFVERKAKHNARLEEIEKEISELETTIPEKMEIEEKIVYLHDAIEMLKDESISAADKNEYLKQFIQRIEFSREKNNEFILDIYLY